MIGGDGGSCGRRKEEEKGKRSFRGGGQIYRERTGAGSE